jgi:hypothetical protein
MLKKKTTSITYNIENTEERIMLRMIKDVKDTTSGDYKKKGYIENK